LTQIEIFRFIVFHFDWRVLNWCYCRQGLS